MPVQLPGRKPTADRPLTGRMVLVGLLAFFGVILVADGALIRLATSTFGGVDTRNAYRVGLAFNDELSAATEQDSRHWRVSGAITRVSGDAATIRVLARDRHGAPLSGLAAHAKLAHPADARRDRHFDLQPSGNGIYGGTVNVPPGKWIFEIELSRGAKRLFRSRSQIVLR
jgi:nitrogen fixation protein FixH